MTKDELVALAERCWATWNQWPPDQKAAYDAWWRMLSDLDAASVDLMITRLAVSNSFCPKVGELRRLVIGNDAPSASEAWSAYLKLDSAINHGTQVPVVDEIVKRTVQRCGSGLHTNGDRQFFVDAYNEIVAFWRQDKYAP